MSESDDEVQLSAQALSALQEFYAEQDAEKERLTEAMSGNVDKYQPKEDWVSIVVITPIGKPHYFKQLSQFWYDDKTAEKLAKEALTVVGEEGRIACVSSPTVYKKLRELKSNKIEAKCLEYDSRFQIYNEDFIFYDYKEPLRLDEALKNSFDIVIADPPFLSEECLCKTAMTIKFLAKEKIILCTGAVMADLAKRLLQVTPCKFEPMHVNSLQNKFMCYTNYESTGLN